MMAAGVCSRRLLMKLARLRSKAAACFVVASYRAVELASCAKRAYRRSLVETLARIRMGLDPMAGDVPSAGDPDIVVLHHIVEQPFEAGCAGGMSSQAHVQADRHHFRLGGAFTVKHVEGIAHES